MANLKEDWIDFSKLEQELSQAVEKDARYWRENDAKFRAVGQKVETYEQFRDIVAAAHIRPLEKNDKIGQGKRNQPWNPYTSKAAGPESSISQDFSPKESGNLPESSHAFTRDWKQRFKTTHEKYEFLKCIGNERLGLIFHTEISFGLLGEIITVLNEEFQADDHRSIVDILMSLSRTNRFGLSLDFLSKGEKEQLGQLFQKLVKGTVGFVSLEDRAEVINSGDENKDLTKEEDGLPGTSRDVEQNKLELIKEDLTYPEDKLSELRELYKS